MSDHRTTLDRLPKAVRSYCRAVVGEHLGPVSCSIIQSVEEKACANTPRPKGPDEARLLQVLALRRAVTLLHQELTAQTREAWPYDDEPANDGLVEFVIEQATRPLEEVPTKEDVWEGRCEIAELERSLLRPVDPLIWATEIRTLRGSPKSLIHLCEAGSIEELDRAETCLLLAERLARKQASVDRFFRSRGTSTADYTRRAIATLRIAAGSCPAQASAKCAESQESPERMVPDLDQEHRLLGWQTVSRLQ